MDGSCETLLSWLTSLSVRGSFPRSDCPCGCLLSFTVRLSPETPVALSSRKTPTTTVFHTWDLAPLTMTSLGREMPKTITCENKSSSIEVILVIMSFGFLYPPFLILINQFNHFPCQTDTLLYMYITSLQICPSNK